MKRVAIVAIIKDTEVLFGKRRDSHYRRPGELELPGGKAEPGETMEMAAAREVFEETNLKVDNLVEIGKIISDYPDNNPKEITLFTCKFPMGSTPFSASGDYSEFRWVSPSQIPSDAVVPEADLKLLKLLQPEITQ